MHDDLRSVPFEQRPKFLPVFPRGWVYFRSWRTARWFLAMQVPVVASVAAAVVRGLPYSGVAVLAALGLVVTALLFVTVLSGMASSNTGTYFRDREPVRFWQHVAVLGIGYVGVAVAGYFV